MSAQPTTTSHELSKKDRAYTTKTLYLDPKRQKKLFITCTYNYEGSSGEEFLIRLFPWKDESSERGVNRLIFVSGDGPHVPLYRARLHTTDSATEIFLSSAIHGGARVNYTNYADRTAVPVSRVARSQLMDAETRTFGGRTELAEDLNAFGLELVEKTKKKNTSRTEMDGLPMVRAVVNASTPERVASSRSKVPKLPTPSVSSASSVEVKDSASSAKFLIPKVSEGIRKKLKTNPVQIDPEEHGLTLVSSDKCKINEILHSMISADDFKELEECEYVCSVMKHESQSKILIFEDISLANFQLYEGTLQTRTPTCPFTGAKIVLRTI